MKKHLFAALLFTATHAAAQVGAFGGPSVLSQGLGSVGQRSGQDVDFKYFGSLNGIYDTGLTPLTVENGQILRPGGLWGVEAGLAAYGRHDFRRSSLGLDYSGNFRKYTSNTALDGANQLLRVEYAHQVSQRLLIATNGVAGTQTFGTALASLGGSDVGVDGSALLFDNRTSYVQGGMRASYALTRRTAFTAEGSGYMVARKASSLVGVKGFTLQGTLIHQIGRRSYIGASYSFLHYDFPRAFGESAINSYNAFWKTELGRKWELYVGAGIFQTAVQGVRDTALDPEIAALLGIGSVRTIFYKENTLPSGRLALSRKFRRASWSAIYDRSMTPGNGLFLTSRRETVSTDFSYTSARKWSFSIFASRSNMTAIGQDLMAFQQTWAGFNTSYRLRGGLNLTAQYGLRYQDLQTTAFPRFSTRASIGFSYSPDSIPISFR